MSTPNAGSGDGRTRPVLDQLHFGPFDRLHLRDVAASLSTLSFWCAIVLPVLYLPLLATGIESVSGLALFLGLFGFHVLALVGGRVHAGAAEA